MAWTLCVEADTVFDNFFATGHAAGLTAQGTATWEWESAGRTLARSPGPHVRPPKQAKKAAPGEVLLRPQDRVGLPAGVSALPGCLPDTLLRAICLKDN